MLVATIISEDKEPPVQESPRELQTKFRDQFSSKMTWIKIGPVLTTFSLAHNHNNKKEREISLLLKRHQWHLIQHLRVPLREEWIQIWLSTQEDKI